jgi:drug/metabolite transporter (DMT)-like permease
MGAFLRLFRSDSDSLATGFIFGILAALIWGAWPVATRFGVHQTLDVYDLTALRFSIAGLILLPIFLRNGVQGMGWPRALIMAAGAGVFYMLAGSSGFQFAPAGHGGVLIPSTMLTTTMIGSWILLGDKPTPMRLLGYGILLLGIMMIGRAGFLGSAGPDAWMGELLFICAGMLWALYTVTLRTCDTSPLRATASVSVISMVVFLPLYLIFGDSKIPAAPWEEIALQGSMQGLGSGVLALLFYSRAVKVLGAARGALFAALVPGTTVLLAYPALGETPNAWELSGLVIVSAGMFYALGLNKLISERG